MPKLIRNEEHFRKYQEQVIKAYSDVECSDEKPEQYPCLVLTYYTKTQTCQFTGIDAFCHFQFVYAKEAMELMSACAEAARQQKYHITPEMLQEYAKQVQVPISDNVSIGSPQKPLDKISDRE